MADAIRWEDPVVKTVAVCMPEPHAARLADVLRHRLGVTADACEDLNAAGDADIYLVTAADALRALARVGPDRVAIMMGMQSAGPEERALYRGAALLSGPLPGAVIDWLESRVASAQSPVSGPDIPWEDSSPPDPVTAVPVPAAGVGKAMSVAVYSSGGGVGKTTTAVHLAMAAAASRVVTGLVELDEDRRGILTHFDRKPRSGLDDLSPTEWEDPQRFAAAMERVSVSVNARLTVVPMVGTLYGMQYQAAPDSPDHLSQLFNWAERRFSLTVYDLPARVRDHVVLSTLTRATRVVIVVEPTEIMVDSTMSYLDLIRSIKGAGPEIVAKASLLCNKVPKHRQSALPPRQIADALDLPFLGEIPLDPDRYMGGINRHTIKLDDGWRAVFDGLGVVRTGASPDIRRPQARRRGVLGSLFRR